MSVRWLVGRSVGLSIIISYMAGKLHFHDLIVEALFHLFVPFFDERNLSRELWVFKEMPCIYNSFINLDIF